MNDLRRVSGIIGAIYDCTLDPERWRETLPHFLAFIQSPCGALAIHDYEQGRTARVFTHGFEESFLKLYSEKYQELDPLPPAIQGLQVGEIATLTMLVDEKEFLASRFYREFAQPYRMRDAITAVVLRSEQRIAMLLAKRYENQPRYGEEDVQRLGILVPHICRALAISDATDLRSLKSHALEVTLDNLTVGVFLLDRDGRIVHANRTGERQLKTGNALRVASHRLVACSGETQTELSRAIATAAKSDFDEATDARPIVLPDPTGPGYVANVLPIGGGERRRLLAPFAAMVAVFVQDPAVAPRLPGEAFAKMYGLTGGELRLLLALAPGLTIKEATVLLGISEATGKSHLHRIFAKTGTSRQTELLHRLMRAAPPIQLKLQSDES